MKTAGIPLGCACCSFNRRRFLAGAGAACAAAALPLRDTARAAETPAGKIRIRILYSLHAPKQPGPDWPNVGFDFQPVMEKFNKELGDKLPNFEFLPAMANGPEAAKKIIDQDKDIDGYLVYQMNCWNRVVQTVAATGKPTLYADFQYAGSGGFLVYTAGFLRKNAPNVGFVASSNFADHVAAVKCFEIVKKGGTMQEFVAAAAKARVASTPPCGDMACKEDKLTCLSPADCIKKMKESKILAVGGGWPGIAPKITQEMGIPVVNVPFKEVNEAWEKADKDQSRALADRWKKNAAKVESVEEDHILKAAAMYYGMKAVLAKHNADAITINCLGGFYGKHIFAYPCLGFHELCNEGLIGACECDVRSTATMVALKTLTQGRPGYISDPVIDTASHQIIYAHCVASNKVFGPKGPTNPYEILTHSEDRQGASLRSIMPEAFMTTTVEFGPDRKQILFHRAKAVGNSPDDRACRTKLCAVPVGDIEKLFTEWDRWGWHRVTVYGDLKEPIFALADALGWKVIEEA